MTMAKLHSYLGREQHLKEEDRRIARLIFSLIKDKMDYYKMNFNTD